MAETRRTFLKFLVFLVNACTGALFSIPIVGYLVGPVLKNRDKQWVEAGSLESFKSPDPKPARVKYTSTAGYKETKETLDAWITVNGEEATVFSSKCTHLGCNISWKPNESGGHFFCPCHGGTFDREGRVLGGPPPVPLKRIPAKIENGKILVNV